MADRPRSQDQLFTVEPEWAEAWKGMPEYRMDDLRPESSIRVNFLTDEDRAAFFSKLEIKPTPARGIFYPPRKPRRYPKPDEIPPLPQGSYPVYIVSKGRADQCLTARALDELGIEYLIAVEQQEVELYAENIQPDRILELPFSNLGNGSIDARNFVWEHSLGANATRHWVLDDNIHDFARYNNNEARKIYEENPFIPCEQFVDRYTNVALAGMHYRGLGSSSDPLPPFRLNTRIYSCILIDNNLSFRWRGRYNEDTDLSLRVLKAGYVTVLFNAYRIHKAQTMTMNGGNEKIYAGNGREKMARSLMEQHPDVVTITHKWGRWQHKVNYKPFSSNALKARAASEAQVKR
jgi:TET-Associated Glycosyltransferase